MKRWRDWLVDGLIDGLWMYVNYVLQVKLYKWRWKSFRTSFMLSAITKLKFENRISLFMDDGHPCGAYNWP